MKQSDPTFVTSAMSLSPAILASNLLWPIYSCMGELVTEFSKRFRRAPTHICRALRPCQVGCGYAPGSDPCSRRIRSKFADSSYYAVYITCTVTEGNDGVARYRRIVATQLHIKHSLHGFPGGETYCCHWHDFQIANRETNIEPSPASLAIHRLHRLVEAHPLIRPYEAANLHSPADHFKGIRYSLRCCPRNSADNQVRNGSGPWFGRRVRRISLDWYEPGT